jgi:hypothetical protein
MNEQYIATALDQAIKAAGIPICGVSIPSTDPASWVVHFLPAATSVQRTQAQTIIAGFNPTTTTAAVDEAAVDSDKRMKAIVLWCAQRFGITPAQAKSQILTIYRSLES